ncbi:MAG: hypothetical protein HFH34_13175 [Eubacterium sp.]|nr:hypothetical protein [Eubacterium sp.]
MLQWKEGGCPDGFVLAEWGDGCLKGFGCPDVPVSAEWGWLSGGIGLSD